MIPPGVFAQGSVNGSVGMPIAGAREDHSQGHRGVIVEEVRASRWGKGIRLRETKIQDFMEKEGREREDKRMVMELQRRLEWDLDRTKD